MKTFTDPDCGSSLSPSCSLSACWKVGPVGSGVKFTPGGSGPSSGVNSTVKSKVPVSPVSSTTGRSTPVSGLDIADVMSATVTFRAPKRNRPALFDGEPTTPPQIVGYPPAIVIGAAGAGPGVCGAGGAVEHDASA